MPLERAIWLLFASLAIHSSAAFSASGSNLDASRRKLAAALASPSGKLTLSPELVIPEPKDATSILLLSNAVQTLSEGIRNCNANAAFLQGSLNALQTFTNEQTTALGNFPGPVPVIYCEQEHTQATSLDFVAIAEAGADGVLVPVAHDTLSTSEWTGHCQAARHAGLQPIPEIIVSDQVLASWSESDVEDLVTRVVEALGGKEPVGIVLTIEPTDEAATSEHATGAIPTIAKATTKRVPILGSVRATAGENRLWEETMRYKEAGFSGTILRSDCVPGFRLQPNLEMVSKFWQACITDLKSTRSKSFSFRSKNQLNVSAATKWGNYQKNVIDSGALGDPQESASLNEAAGDYQGF